MYVNTHVCLTLRLKYMGLSYLILFLEENATNSALSAYFSPAKCSKTHFTPRPIKGMYQQFRMYIL